MTSLPTALGHLGHRGWFGLPRRAPATASEVEASARASGARVARADAFRPDIEGLRGLAILLVVLYHAGLVSLPGGFIGVDVFFVISGFLITGLLLRERERTGRISLRGFYVRRVRRLMPAALVTIAVILPIAAVVVAPLDRGTVSLDGAAAAISVANVRFAGAEGSYFTVLAGPSPFTHFWSLSVEEQFYLVWPALLLLGARGPRPRPGAAIVLASVFVASLAACLYVTDVAPSWAFYMLPTRAWQLATGGLLAIAGVWLTRLPHLPIAALGWAGLAAVLVTPFAIDASMPYPGTIALLPTLGAAALIAGGERRWSPTRLVAVAPLRLLGRISYSLYLWHWPILVLPAIAVGAPLEPAARAGLVAVSIAVAALSWALIEQPFRRGVTRTLARRTRTVAFATAGLALVVAVGGDLRYEPAHDLDLASVSQADPVTDGSGDDAGIDWTTTQPGLVDDATNEADPLGDDLAASPDPTVTPDPTAAPAAKNTPPPQPPKVSYVLPGDIRPSLADAQTDTERPWRDGCLLSEGGTIPPDCVYGDPKGHFLVALIGDSHASALFPAVQAIAKHHGWRLETYLKVDCPFIDMRIRSLTFKREYRECTAWRANVLDRLAASPPDLVIVSNSRWIYPVLNEDATVASEGAASARMIARMPGLVAVVADVPASDNEIPTCLSAHVADIRPCAVPRSDAFSGGLLGRERLATRLTGARLVDMTRAVCPADPCQFVVGGMIVLRDKHHLTATFARSLAPALDKALARMLRPPAPVAPTAPTLAPTPIPTPDSDRPRL